MTAEVVRRRTVLGTAAAATLAPAGLLAGCAMGSDDGKPKEEGQANAKNPLGVKEDAPLEVVIFNGGFGEDYAKAHEAMYKETYPKAEIKHSAVVEISKALQPRFVDGNPPDVDQQLRRGPDRPGRPGLPGRARRPHPTAGRAEPGRARQDGPPDAAARRGGDRHASTARRTS